VTSISNIKRPSILAQTLDEAFPAVDPGVTPFGSLVLIQVKAAATRTKSGLILTKDTVETESDNTRIAKVIALGPLAFHTRDTQQPWPEGAWANPGDYVRIPIYGGDRWRVLLSSGKDARGVEQKVFAEFALIEDLTLKGKVTGDPLAQLAFL
jgi:co-chaperonin GroES (HSP10)